MDENNPKYKKLIEDTDKKLKGMIAQWVLRYDYFGFLFSLVRRKAEVGLSNPAAIAPTPDGKLELLYNPILIAATPDGDIHEMLHHEGLHILNKHISRLMRILADIPKAQHKGHVKLINVASDCCVNAQGNIKSPLMIAGKPFKLHYPQDHDLEPDKIMENYYYTLLERERQKCQDPNQGNGGEENDNDDQSGDNNSPDKNDDKDPSEDENNGNGSPQEDDEPKDNDDDQQPGEGSGDGEPIESDSDGKGSGKGGEPQEGEGNPSQPQPDNSDLGNHQYWSSDKITDPYATSRKIDTYTQRIIRESAKNYRNSKSRGNLPGYLQDLIEKALKPVPIPYYEIIRQLVKGSRVGKFKRSSAHINRKRTYVFQIADENVPIISPFPGRKRDLTFDIGVIIDTSGSQSPEDIMEALSGCKHIIEKDRHCKTTVLEVDTIIHKEYELKRVADLDFDVKGRGGTTLLPGVERCRELKVDVCLCFTDGYTENFNEIDRKLFPKRMIWVITPGGSEDGLNRTGYVVHLPERENS